MKKLIKTALSALLALAVGAVPTFAVGATDGADLGESANTVRKFTPVIDGVIDEEYLSSYRLSYKWDETDRELCFGTGGFGFMSRDESGEVIFEDGLPVKGDDSLYGWDCGIEAYFAWDNESVYIAMDVTDDDYACLADEALERAKDPDVCAFAPMLNDCVALSLKTEESTNVISTERGGRFIALDGVFSKGNLCDVAYWQDGGEADPSRIFAVKETDHGYIMEICLPITEEEKESLLCDGGQFSCLITVTDSSPDSGLMYGAFGFDEMLTEDERDLAFVDSIVLDTPEVTLTLSDEEAFILPPYDLTGDGAFDAKDLTRLMRVIAGDGAATVAQSADINGDGAVDVKDMTRMMKHLAGAEAIE